MLPGLKRMGLQDVPGGLNLREATAELQRGQRLGAELLTCQDARYPKSWSLELGWPLAFWVRGEWLEAYAAQTPSALAVVGTRRASMGGQQFAADLSEEAVLAGIHVVSGLALGIDTAAHTGALRGASLGGMGRTVAVLAGGIDRPSPPANHDLARQILDAGGALLSTAAVGSAPFPKAFPIRNRYIAGLSSAVAVVEAGATSGALHTARAALEHNLEVGVAPARPWDAHALGSLALLKDGATPLVEAADGWRLLPNHARPQGVASSSCQSPGSPLEKAIRAALAATFLPFEGLHRRVVGEVAQLSATLEVGLLDGWLTRRGDGSYGLTLRSPGPPSRVIVMRP